MTDDPLALLAASRDPERRITIAAAFARAGSKQTIHAIHELVEDPIADVRMLAQIALARAGDTNGDSLSDRLAREHDLGVYAVLAARAGRVPVSARALANLAIQAAHPAAPAELRAGCAWAVAERDAVRGGWLVGSLLADDETAFWLASIAAARGGALAPVVAGLHARPELDQVWAILRM